MVDETKEVKEGEERAEKTERTSSDKNRKTCRITNDSCNAGITKNEITYSNDEKNVTKKLMRDRRHIQSKSQQRRKSGRRGRKAERKKKVKMLLLTDAVEMVNDIIDTGDALTLFNTLLFLACMCVRISVDSLSSKLVSTISSSSSLSATPPSSSFVYSPPSPAARTPADSCVQSSLHNQVESISVRITRLFSVPLLTHTGTRDLRIDDDYRRNRAHPFRPADEDGERKNNVHGGIIFLPENFDFQVVQCDVKDSFGMRFDSSNDMDMNISVITRKENAINDDNDSDSSRIITTVTSFVKLELQKCMRHIANQADEHGITPLCRAACMNSVSVINLLLHIGTRIKIHYYKLHARTYQHIHICLHKLYICGCTHSNMHGSIMLTYINTCTLNS